MKRYIGVPFRAHGRDMEGFDCIGLVLHVLEHEYGQSVPDMWRYDDPNSIEVAQTFMVEVVAAGTQISKWKPCAPKAGAVVLFRIRGIIRHIGVMIDDRRFLHTMENVATCVESIDSPAWAKRIEGFYEWSA
ncbi:C40 family peptidase [Hydrogenimonas urashimensis]|uniref:C40 family peptidase n=1 Tax=Hydrogenimonas urashimensis TaxID=2740515 RepID=UPI0019165427|nr:NlpC/P60 family protein [Hydrogenimonas urashimensis]